MPKTVLFVSHSKKNCGVHEFGYNVADTIRQSKRYDFVYVECDSLEALHQAIDKYQPSAIIYNYYASTMPWLRSKVVHTLYRPLNTDIRVPQLGIMHEMTQELADRATNLLFDYIIAPDPTLLLKNPIVFKTGRLIPSYINHFPLPDTPVIGSFGFATPNKGFEEIVRTVQKEFDQAVIRFNIPSADFGDSDGSKARALVEACRLLINKPEIRLEITHDFLSKPEILDFLAQNTINVFLYQDKYGRGLSSTVDYALAVNRPLAVSDSIMFRHLHGVDPSVVVGRSSLRQIMENGPALLDPLRKEWDGTHLVWEYERIADAVLAKEKEGRKKRVSWLDLPGQRKKTFSWLHNTKNATEDLLTVDRTQSYTPIEIPSGQPLNRILDNAARALYKPAIDKLTELVPLTMAKKIPEANVQQAFVFDTVFRHLKDYTNPRILCVGSYEDTAALSLKRLGIQMEEIDPVLNYYLQEYYTRPGTTHSSYDIIFSTSVIEHDPDDESFMRCINGLLAPGGLVVLTCDYKDQWKPGDPKPDVDARLYTQKDLRDRFLPIMAGCTLVDQPSWDCPAPDFVYLKKYKYTFASWVAKKQNNRIT